MADEPKPRPPVTNLGTAPDFYADFALGCTFTAGNVRIPMISRRRLEDGSTVDVCTANLVLPIECAKALAAEIEQAMKKLADVKAAMPDVPTTRQ